MDMRVDQPGHHRSTADIDDGGVRALDWPVGDLLEAIALDQDIDALAQFAAGGIEEIAVAEQEHGVASYARGPVFDLPSQSIWIAIRYNPGEKPRPGGRPDGR